VVVDADDPAFLHPVDMPATIAAYLRRTGQPGGVADDPIRLGRVIVEALALAYRTALERAERLAMVRVGVIHVVGGGARNRLLCQLTADACRRSVLAGPVEATALGNVLTQAMGAGEIRDVAEAHVVAGRSTPVAVYEPGDAGDWDERVIRLHALRPST